MNNNATQKYRKTKKGVLTNIYGKLNERNKKKFGFQLNFSLKEFQERYLNSYEFISAFENWENNGYKYYDKPSIDRINPDLPYEFDNMQVLTWRENREKGEKERSRITTAVSMFTINGEYIRDFSSIKEAVAATGLNQSGITSCCTGMYKQTGGYIFRYLESGYKKTKNVIRNIHDNPELLEVQNGTTN